MKFITTFLVLFFAVLSFGQQSEVLIPKDAVTVFSLNNIQLFQKVSLDDLIRYEFMAELQQELFDGSTRGKTLKDSGIDFDKKLNVFYGKGDNFELSGFTFGVKDKAQLFTVFDDFEKMKSPYPATEMYGSFFNNLILSGENALLIRVEPTMERVDEITDSIWYSRGNENPWMNQFYDETLYDDPDYDGPFEDPGKMIFDESDPNQKNYFELRDSVMAVYQKIYFNEVCEELFVKNYNLLQHDLRFAEQIKHNSEGIFYLDNSRSLQKAQNLWYIQTMFPTLYKDIREIYTGNVILGDLFLMEKTIEFHVEARYGEQLGSIYQRMNDSKFDKNILKYIQDENTAYFTYNINLREAYEQAYKVIVPILSNERSVQVAYNLLLLELLNEYVNKDALFSTYKGTMFGTFNGIKKIKTRKIEFTYDENTFEYEENEVEAEEDMPIFTIGFSTDRGDIPVKVLKHLSRLTSRFKNMGNYWVYEEAILDAAPLYMIHKNGLFIFTNDEDLAKNHSNGFGKNALSKKKAKRARKSGFMYSYIDWENTISSFPRDFFSAEQNDMIDAMRGKTGTMELTSSKTTKSKTNFKLVYDFDGTKDSPGKHLLDLINTLYVVTR